MTTTEPLQIFYMLKISDFQSFTDLQHIDALIKEAERLVEANRKLREALAQAYGLTQTK